MGPYAALLLLVACASAHMCMISPPQRGGYDISTPASHVCFQPQAPCGSQAGGSPTMTFVAGSAGVVLIQQNLNHYNPGFPGLIDVAYSNVSNPASDDDFILLAVVPDVWVGQRWNQKNLSIPFQVPNITTTHGVLRVRYNSNKGVEPIFHQCADIAVTAPATSWGGHLYAVADVVYTNGPAALVEIHHTGRVSVASGSFKDHQLNIRSSSSPVALSDGVTTVDGDNIWMVGNYMSDWLAAAPSHRVFQYTRGSGWASDVKTSLNGSSQQFVALLPELSQTGELGAITLDVYNAQQQEYLYTLNSFNPTTGVLTPLVSSNHSFTWVNFLQALYDPFANLVYLIAADENAPTGTHTQVTTFNVNTLQTTSIVLDTSVYNIAFGHLACSTSSCDSVLYSLSPGSWPRTAAVWQLVSINLSTGAVSPIGSRKRGCLSQQGADAEARQALGSFSTSGWADHYTGVVRPNAVLGTELLHVFSDALTGVPLAVRVDLTSGEVVSQTPIVDGTNNWARFRSYTWLPSA